MSDQPNTPDEVKTLTPEEAAELMKRDEFNIDARGRLRPVQPGDAKRKGASLRKRRAWYDEPLNETGQMLSELMRRIHLLDRHEAAATRSDAADGCPVLVRSIGQKGIAGIAGLIEVRKELMHVGTSVMDPLLLTIYAALDDVFCDHLTELKEIASATLLLYMGSDKKEPEYEAVLLDQVKREAERRRRLAGNWEQPEAIKELHRMLQRSVNRAIGEAMINTNGDTEEFVPEADQE